MELLRITALLAIAACSRSVPSSFPNEEAPLPHAGTALAEDPPLDGGWPGLGNPPPAMEHHHHAQ